MLQSGAKVAGVELVGVTDLGKGRVRESGVGPRGPCGNGAHEQYQTD